MAVQCVHMPAEMHNFNHQILDIDVMACSFTTAAHCFLLQIIDIVTPSLFFSPEYHQTKILSQPKLSDVVLEARTWPRGQIFKPWPGGV